MDRSINKINKNTYVDKWIKSAIDQNRRLAVIMRLLNVMTALLNLWEEIREPSENEDLLFFKQTYCSSTWEVRKSWWRVVMNSYVLAHPAGLQGISIKLSKYYSSKATSPAPAPLRRLNSLLTLTGNLPRFLSSIDQWWLRDCRSLFLDFSRIDPLYITYPVWIPLCYLPIY